MRGSGVHTDRPQGAHHAPPAHRQLCSTSAPHRCRISSHPIQHVNPIRGWGQCILTCARLQMHWETQQAPSAVLWPAMLLGHPKGWRYRACNHDFSWRKSHPVQKGCLLNRNDFPVETTLAMRRRAAQATGYSHPKGKVQTKLPSLLQPLASHWLYLGPCRVLPPLSMSH